MKLPIQSDSTRHPRRKPLGNLGPIRTAVGSAVDASSFAPLANRVIAINPIGFGDRSRPAIETIAQAIPHRYDDCVRIGRTHHHIDHTGLIVDKQNLLPSLPAIGGFINTSLRVAPVQSTCCTYIHGIGVPWVDQDACNLIRSVQTKVLKGFSTIDGLVNSVSIGDRIPRIDLSGSHPEDFFVVRIGGDTSNRDHLLPIELMLKRSTMIGRLEQPTRCGRDPPQR